MGEDSGYAIVRPPVVRQVSLALYATAVALFAVALLAFGLLLEGWFDRSLPIHILCALFILVIAGAAGGLFHVLMARAFAGSSKIAYEWVRSTSWSPLVAVVSSAGQRLDSPEVRRLFGVQEEEAKQAGRTEGQG
ncbi:MAG: hypothetical protein ACM3JD_16130 [Rudaea sp.]